MTMDQINYVAQTGAIGLIIFLFGFIKIPKLELNIWSWLGRSFGRAINGEVMEEVKKIDSKLDAHINKEEEEYMRRIRQRILRFNDEILTGKRHSKEHFDEILSDIDIYETYCAEHINYKNNKAVLAIETIEEVYSKCAEEHDFLTYNNRK